MSIEFNKPRQGDSPTFGNGVKAGHTSKSHGSTTGRTAADNLSKSSLSSKDWASMNGSLFQNKKVQIGTNSRQYSQAGGFGSNIRTTQNGNYVSSGYWNQRDADAAMRKQLLTGNVMYANTRAIGFTGGTWSAGMRAWNNQMQMQQAMLHELSPKETWYEKMAKYTTLATGAAGVLAAGIKLFQAFKGDGKSDEKTKNPDIAALQNAKDRKSMATALETANLALKDIDRNLGELSTQKTEAASKTEGLKNAWDDAVENTKAAEKELESLQKQQAKAQELVDAANSDIAENQKYLAECNDELATLSSPQDDERIAKLQEEIECRNDNINSLNNQLTQTLMPALQNATQQVTNKHEAISELIKAEAKAHENYNANISYLKSIDKAIDDLTPKREEYTNAINAANQRLSAMPDDTPTTSTTTTTPQTDPTEEDEA